MGTSVHTAKSEAATKAPQLKLEAEVQQAIRQNESRGSFFAGCVLWFCISVPFWAALVWLVFFR